MMYGMSPMRRALYFILPLVFALILTGIVVIDAATTPELTAADLGVELAPDEHWLLFDFREEAAHGREIVGTVVSVAVDDDVLIGEITPNIQRLFFKVGDVDAIGDVTVVWPTGREQHYTAIPLDARYRMVYPESATTALNQWLAMNGPLYQLGAWLLLGVLLVLFVVRVVVWAESGRGAHGEVFMR